MSVLHRHRLAALLFVLCCELLLAGWWRWPWTAAPIQTPFDYGTGHVTVVSENWRRHGALRQHFLPVLSTDPELPEWVYRTEFSQEYYSVPPLAFILHYGATRLFDRIEPVLLGKLLAQFLICVSTLGAATFLYGVFGAWPALIGLSFLIWGVPFLLWFANGYFAVNVGLAVQLVLVSWCCAVANRSVRVETRSDTASVAANVAIGGALAFLGGFADYLPFAANAVAIAGLPGLAAIRWDATARRPLLASALGVLIGSLAAGVSTVFLYSRQMGWSRYWRALTTRVAERSGQGPVSEHIDVIRRQMLTAWPSAVLVALMVMLCIVLAWCVISLIRHRAGTPNDQVLIIILALMVSILPSFFFHYSAMNYVAIHWWFSGTWTLGWVFTLCAFVWLVRRAADSIRRASPRLTEWGYSTCCVVLWGLVIGSNLSFASEQKVDDPRFASVQLYRSLGHELPADGLPLIVTDLNAGRPGLFEDFPYTTAYLRRPVLLREPGGAIRLPAGDELFNGQLVHFGGEDMRTRILRRGGSVYIAYDPEARRCDGVDVPLSAWHVSVPINVCRASAAEFVQRPEAVLETIHESGACEGPPDAPADLHLVTNADHVVELAWTGTLRGRTTYLLEAGRAPGLSDVLTNNVGRTRTFTASDVKPATYYARVKGTNPCGTSGASNELVVVVR